MNKTSHDLVGVECWWLSYLLHKCIKFEFLSDVSKVHQARTVYCGHLSIDCDGRKTRVGKKHQVLKKHAAEVVVLNENVKKRTKSTSL